MTSVFDQKERISTFKEHWESMAKPVVHPDEPERICNVGNLGPMPMSAFPKRPAKRRDESR